MRRISASAVSAIISPRRSRCDPAANAAARPRISACWPPIPDAWNAGNAPKTSPQTADAASAKASAAPSKPTPSSRGVPSGAALTSARSSQEASTTPSAPPAVETSVLSTSSCDVRRRASAAERRAHGELVPARRAARDEEVGDVDARDEQQKADGAEQREQRQPDAGHEPVRQQLRVRADAGVRVRMLALERDRDAAQLAVRRLQADAGLEPPDAR